MRIIDADKLKETIHINHYPLRGGINSIDNGMWTIGIDQAIDEQPTIDAVPVVRCKDCVNWLKDIDWCKIHSSITLDGDWNMFDGNDYCSYGERKTDGRNI